MRFSRVGPPLLAALLVPVSGTSQAAYEACTPAALDHVPIVVGSLDRARLTYEQLGFRLKPGRLHANGLRNAFAKFPGGGYLELISPEHGAVDAQSGRYVAQLEAGEGGSALALRADSLRAAGARLQAAGVPARTRTFGSAFAILSFSDADLGWLFLIDYIRPVIDGPELLAHPNTATGIETVWVTEQAFATLPAIADELCLPDIRQAAGAPGSAPVAGVTIRVRSADAARQTLRAAGVEHSIRTGSRGASVVVPSRGAHGIFIELLESDAASHPRRPGSVSRTSGVDFGSPVRRPDGAAGTGAERGPRPPRSRPTLDGGRPTCGS